MSVEEPMSTSNRDIVTRIQRNHVVVLVCALVLCVGGVAVVQSYTGEAQENGLPMVLPYQGTLSKAGAPFTGVQAMRFKLYSDASGAAFWTSDPRNVDVVGGKFAVTLGDANDANKLEAQDFRHAELYVELVVDGTTLSPKQRVAPAPQAISAAQAAGDFTIPGELNVLGDVVVEGALLRPGGGSSPPMLGSYCGATAGTTGLITAPDPHNAQKTLTGYRAAKRLCEVACNTTRAHMCSSHEVSISVQQTREVWDEGWFTSFSTNLYEPNTQNLRTRDCEGWTSDNSNAPTGDSHYGMYLDTDVPSTNVLTGGVVKPDIAVCSSSLPILCCH